MPSEIEAAVDDALKAIHELREYLVHDVELPDGIAKAQVSLWARSARDHLYKAKNLMKQSAKRYVD